MTDLYNWGGGTDAPTEVTNSLMNQAQAHFTERVNREALLSGLYGIDYVSTNGAALTFGYRAGSVRSGNAVVATAAGTLLLTADETNYVEVHVTTGVVSANIVGFTSTTHIPLFQVVCGASSFNVSTAVTDVRTWAVSTSGTIPDASTSTKGMVKMSVAPVSPTAPIAAGDNDPRMSDSREPSGAAGGVLGGTFPNPSFAADMATQAELDTHTSDTSPHSGHFDVDGSKALSGDLDAGGNLLSNLADGVVDSDAATVGQLGTISSGFKPRGAVRVATVAALAANTRTSNTLTASANGSINAAGIDGVTNLAIGDAVLVKNEAVGANNGVYEIDVVGSGGVPWSMTRRADFDSSGETVNGLIFPVSEGAALAGSRWYLSTLNTMTLNTTALVFTQDSNGRGEINTASNDGTEGVGVFEGKSGVNFKFRNLVSKTTDILTIAYNATTRCLEFSIDAAGIAINDLLGVLGVAKGGTGLSTIEAGEILVGDGTDSFAALAPNAATKVRFLASYLDGSDQKTEWRIIAAAGYDSQSGTSLTIGAGSKVVTTQAGLAFQVGNYAVLINSLDANKWMAGVVTDYTGTALTILVDDYSGTGTLSSWYVSLAGRRGPMGADSVQAANKVKAGPTSGADALPTYRSLVSDDIPALAISKTTGLQTELDDVNADVATVASVLSSHAANTSNPHSVTKTQVGLGNADNTSDANKPVSTAQQTALDAKISNSLVDAKGDILTATANDTPGRLAVGSNGQTLVADSTQATGLRYGDTPADTIPSYIFFK